MYQIAFSYNATQNCLNKRVLIKSFDNHVQEENDGSSVIN